MGKLPKGCRASSINEGPDEQRLIDVAHTHLGFKEGYEIVKFHMLNWQRV